MAQCLEYWKGNCHESLSPRNGKKCPYKGYPEGPMSGEGIWEAPAPLTKKED
jgi:hypothetical protein